MGRKELRRNKPFRLKLRFPAWTGGRRNNKYSRYCERCRIKDGLQSSGYIEYGKCSYCGWTGRCYKNTAEHSPSWWGWSRKSNLSPWSRNRKDK